MQFLPVFILFHFDSFILVKTYFVAYSIFRRLLGCKEQCTEYMHTWWMGYISDFCSLQSFLMQFNSNISLTVFKLSLNMRFVCSNYSLLLYEYISDFYVHCIQVGLFCKTGGPKYVVRLFVIIMHFLWHMPCTDFLSVLLDHLIFHMWTLINSEVDFLEKTDNWLECSNIVQYYVYLYCWIGVI